MTNKPVSKLRKLSDTVSILSAKEYDRKVLSKEEIGAALTPGRVTQLNYLEKYSLAGEVILSEFIHVSENIEALEKEEVGFRNKGKNQEEITRLEEYKKELNDRFIEKMNDATRKEKFQHDEKVRAEALAIVEPLQLKLKEIIKEMIKEEASIRMAVTESMLSGVTARLMNEIIQSTEYRSV